MHYAGMAAIRPDALQRYDPGMVAVSVVVAVVLAFGALDIRARLLALGLKGRLRTPIAAVVMGCAIPAMHYTAMQAVVFYPLPGAAAGGAPASQTILALTVAGFGLLVGLSVLAAAFAGEQREVANRLTAEVVQRKALELDALNATARLRAIFDAVVDAIVTTDAEGRIQQWSSGAQRMFGYAADEVIGKNITLLMPEPRRSRRATHVSVFLKTGEARMIGQGRELTAIRKDGGAFPMELAVSEVTSQGERLFTSVIRDVTDRKRAEQELILARVQAEDANAAKSQFLATMSHEIRTPMNGVLGMASLLSATPLNEQQRHLVTSLSRSGKALLSIINDILDFSKIEAGKLDLDPVEFDPSEVLGEVADLFAEPCSAKRIELVYRISEEAPSRVRGDSARLRQVLINLVGNAIKFTDHGEVLIELGPADVGATEVILRFTVKDTGIGIEAEKIGRLFQSFEQVDGSMQRTRGGTGLGLAISRQLVEMMGGKIEVESEFGHGSRFDFTVRYERCASGDSDAQAKRAIERPLKVLLVDSNRVSAQVAAEYLTRWTLDATVCHTLEEASVALARGSFDAVLLDVKGMGVPAIELGKQIRAGGDKPDPAVIFLTGVDRLMVDESLAASDAFAVLSKPVRPSELFECMTQLASQPNSGGVAQFFVRRTKFNAVSRFNARLLVAEDNPVNQEVATGILEAMGCQVTIAPNGRIVEQLFAQQRFDLILMDCEMPEMDGLEATRRVRQLEAMAEGRKEGDGQRRRIPIIALTAHALADVRQACLDSGMDDFLTKPFDEARMNDALHRWIPERETPAQPTPQPKIAQAAPPSMPGAIDRSAFEGVAAFRGPNGPALLKKVVGKFQESGPSLTKVVCDTAGEGDIEALWRAAHSLKSGAAAVGATRLSQRCAKIEALGRAGDLDGLKPLLEGLEHELADALAGLAILIEEPDVRVA
jgi:PAS domain S-box-containing protein